MFPLAFGFGGPQDIVILLFLFLPGIFWLVELIDAARRDFPEPNAKILWVLIILLTSFIGALVYYFVGKKQGTLRS